MNHVPCKARGTKDPQGRTHTGSIRAWKSNLFLAASWKAFAGKVTSEFGVSAEYGTPRPRNCTKVQEKHLGGKTKERTPPSPVCLSKFLPVLHPPSPPSVLSRPPNPQTSTPSLTCDKRIPWATASPNAARQGRSNSTCPKWEKSKSPTRAVYSTS